MGILVTILSFLPITMFIPYGKNFLHIININLLFVESSLTSKDLKIFFPAFNFSITCFLTFFGTAFSLQVMRKYRINYIYLIRMKSYSRINQYQIINFAIVFFTLWAIFLYLTYLSLTFDISKIYLFPLLILLTTVLVFIWPFSHFYGDYRFEILFSIFKCFFPFGKFVH